MNSTSVLTGRFLTGNFAIMAFGDLYFLLALYLQNMGVTDPGTLGWILGIYFAASTVTRPLASLVIERFSFRKVMLAASLLCLASGAGVALAGSSVPLILVFRALTGFSSSLFLVGLTTYQVLTVPEKVRGSSFTLASAGTIAPLIALLPIAEWLLRNGHKNFYIWSPILPAFLCLAVTLTIPRKEDPSLGNVYWGTYSEVLKGKEFRTLLASVILFAMTDAAIVSLAGLAMERSLLASSFISSQALTGLLIRLFGFRLMDRLPRNRLAALSFSVTAFALVAVTFVNSNAWMIFGGVVYGIGMGYGFPLHLALIGDMVPARLRPKATSLVWFLMAGCYFVSPVLTGFIARYFNFAWAFRLICGSIILLAPRVHQLFSTSIPPESDTQ